MSKTISGIVTWLRNWFYTKQEVDSLISTGGGTISIEDTDLFDVLQCVIDNFDNFDDEIIFLDDLSSDMSSQYSTRGHIKSGSYPITLSYDSSVPCYNMSASGGDSFTWFIIPNLQGLDNIRVTATAKINNSSAYAQIFLGLCDTLVQTSSSSYKFDFVRIRGDNKLDAVKNDSDTFSNSVTVLNTVVKLVFERNGNTITGRVYNSDGTTLLSQNNYTTTNNYSNPYYFVGLMSRYSNYTYNLYDLRVESL